ncbi:MAG: hypothetical protein H6810_04105 [Phycisphaeraceae bacterium]|nr:MAG: hypothetical protein H6810_04105 [Phycisphaeraceae bacterium]
MQAASGSAAVIGRVWDASNGVERRRVPRYESSGSAVADFGGADGGHVVAGVDLVDSSASGLGFVSPTPATPGQRVRIFLGHSPVPGRSGRVARCFALPGPDGRPRGYRIGLDTGYARAA